MEGKVIPINPKDWTVQNVVSMFESFGVGYEPFLKIIRDNTIDGNGLLFDLDETFLKDSGLNTLQVKRITREIQNWKIQSTQSVTKHESVLPATAPVPAPVPVPGPRPAQESKRKPKYIRSLLRLNDLHDPSPILPSESKLGPAPPSSPTNGALQPSVPRLYKDVVQRDYYGPISSGKVISKQNKESLPQILFLCENQTRCTKKWCECLHSSPSMTQQHYHKVYGPQINWLGNKICLDNIFNDGGCTRGVRCSHMHLQEALTPDQYQSLLPHWNNRKR